MVYHIGMAVNYRLTRDLVQTLMDNVSMTPDTPDRIVMIRELDTLWRRFVTAARDEAAYEARRIYSADDLAALTGTDRHTLDRWVRQHRKRTGAPPLGRRTRIDLSRARDLSCGSIDASHRPVVSE